MSSNFPALPYYGDIDLSSRDKLMNVIILSLKLLFRHASNPKACL